MASSPSSTPESPAPSSTGSPKSTSDTSSSSSSSSSSPSPDSSSPPPPPPGSPPPSKAPPPASSPPPPTESPPPSSPPSPSSPPPSSPPSSPPPLSSPSPSSSRPSPPPSPPPPSPRPSPPPSSPPSQSPATPDSSPPSASKGSPPPSSPSPSPPKSTAPTPSTPAFRAPPPANASPAQTGEAPQSSPSPPSNSAPSPSSSSSSSGRHPSDSPPPPTRSALSPSTNTSSTAVSPSGSLPSVPTTKSTSTPTEFSGNSTVSSSSQSTSHQGMKVGVTAGVLAAIAVIGLIMAFVLLRRRRRKDRYNPYMLPSPYALSQGSGSSFMQHNAAPNLGGNISGSDFANTPSDPGGLGNSRQWFTYEELSAATNGFSSQNILGAGGFGCVYKGFLTDGKEVAVKKLKAGSGQGDREFRAEVEIISRVHHRHLVSLVGYCINEYEKLLVYEFVPNNSLHHHLHGTGRPVMGWGIRVKVAAGSARGIAYLHEDCHPRIIHRDIKSANILLDNNFEAKVADFGLAKLAEELDGGNTHVSTRVMGTFGYMAPEYASSGKLTEKSDVFSFGVVLLELITGRRPVDESQPLGDESLVEWARPLLTQALETEEFEEVADPRLEGNYVRSEMFRMVEAAAACVRHSASKRPRMTQVVRALDSICEPSADLLNGVRPGQSEIFDSREQSAQIRMFQRMAFGSKDYSSEYFNNSRSSFGGGP